VAGKGLTTALLVFTIFACLNVPSVVVWRGGEQGWDCMSAKLGIDVGAVSVKAAILLPSDQAESAMAALGDGVGGFRRLQVPAARTVLVAPYRRTRGRPLEAVRQVLRELLDKLGADRIEAVALTGSGSGLVAAALGVPRFNEFQAIARAVDLLHPHVRTVFEMGGETSKYIRLVPDPADGRLGIADYGMNGDCAAGTGAFLDQQASRLQYEVEDIGTVVQDARRTAQIAGRCSVFAKSDMIHAQQKGFAPPEVLKGLCKAVAMNYKSAVVKGRTPERPVALIGGVSANTAVVHELAEVFGLKDGDLFVPPAAESIGAIGAAILAGEASIADRVALGGRLSEVITAEPAGQDGLPRLPRLTLDKVQLLRERVRPYEFPENGQVIDAYLGLDIGSVGTKLVLIDAQGEVIHHIFTRTEGRPIEVVTRCLRELRDAVGDRVRVCGVGSTGSGRELIGELVGADAIHDEITCHKTGAAFIGDRLIGKRPDTIFEIGGQDSKFISLQPEAGDSAESVVVDFTMNEACAAGTGSFLEERAEELDVSIKGEFGQLALQSKSPIKLGERCTVFMERDVNTCMHRGAKREDIIAGLAYSVVYNYINRVVRGRKIGDCIFFQGGTAYNDAVAAAFSAVTGKEIIVPPHNAVLGAIGAALLAKEKTQAAGNGTRFRGFDMNRVTYTLREFTCKGCGNHCAVQEFNVEGEKTYWGDKCSDRYRKRAKTDRKPVIPDLLAVRHDLLHADDNGDPPHATLTIGVPLAMYTFDLLPLWRRFFRDCGFKVVTSEPTNKITVKAGTDAIVAEPCFPIIVAHGHVADLVAGKVDFIWLPNIISAETKFLDNESHVCPWGQTLPFVVRQSPAFAAWQDRILCPTIRLRSDTTNLREVLLDVAVRLGARRRVAQRAYEAGINALRQFRDRYLEAGRTALETLTRSGETGMVLVGRPYNIHDPGVSLAVARKLRDNYGVNVIPIDALPVSDVDVRDINDNMYWEYGRKILAAARIVSRHPNLHIIYVTNFKCGPDSFVKGFVRSASGGKPFLTLQFDGHSNDAGMMTRCEAYLDSKGILRWWRKQQHEPTERASKDGPSISHKWPTPVPDSWPLVSVPSGSKRSPLRTPIPRP